jgi:hypothetical protein
MPQHIAATTPKMIASLLSFTFLSCFLEKNNRMPINAAIKQADILTSKLHDKIQVGVGIMKLF